MAIMANAGNPIVIGFFILLMLWLAGLTYKKADHDRISCVCHYSHCNCFTASGQYGIYVIRFQITQSLYGKEDKKTKKARREAEKFAADAYEAIRIIAGNSR